jgi:c(7)-type cytochrome triheme protein
VGGDGSNKSCARCHQGRFEERPASQSHAICAPCHAADSAPRMTECGGCHGLGKPRGQLAARDPAFAWYVRDKFRHASHVNDPRGGGQEMTPCATCHDQVAGATRLSEIARPRMQQCDACHDGKLAFKTTGFGCAKCHGPAVKP